MVPDRLPGLLLHPARLLVLVLRRVGPPSALGSADDSSFTWGNTRVVVGEGKSKKVLQADDEVFEESMIPMKKFSGM